MRDFQAKIKRRKLWQASVVYAVVARSLLQVADLVLPIFDTPQRDTNTLATTAICSAPGREEEAKMAAEHLIALDPEIANHARANIEAWQFACGLMEPLIDGLKQAGIAIPGRSSDTLVN